MLSKVFQGLFLLVFAGILSVGSLLSAAAFIWSQELPDLGELDALDFTATSQIFARNGELIGEIYLLLVRVMMPLPTAFL